MSNDSNIDPKAVAIEGDQYGPIALLSCDPPIILSGLAYKNWLGIAPAVGRIFGNRDIGILIYPTWSIEDDCRIAMIRAAYKQHRRQYPQHIITYMCNTEREFEMLSVAGVPAVFLNKNFIVSELIFCPIATEKKFDAIYNARFVPEKRHELCAEVPSVGYVGYIAETEHHRLEQRTILENLKSLAPEHLILNPLSDEMPVHINHRHVNAFLNQASVGLCLSEVEGANYASIEYLLAGLGVVSTPSQGGRDIYFDSEYCIVCAPHPRAVRDAVASLISRNIPQEYIRTKSLQKVVAARGRFKCEINRMCTVLGYPDRNIDVEWRSIGDTGFVKWNHYERHIQLLSELIPPKQDN